MSPHPWPYATDPAATPPLDADRLILWLARHQWRTLLGGVLFGVPWMLSIALVPAAIGKAIDEGLVAGDPRALVTWSAAIMGLGLVSAVTTNGRHWFAVRNWLLSSFRTAVVTERAVRRAGPALTRQMPAGEVVTSFASDFWRMGEVFDVVARFAGAIVSFVVVSVILLRGSVLLGVIMLVGGPLLLASLALVMRPLQRRQQAQREEAGLLTSLGADTVAGLRVLRGIGGEDAFLARYAAQSDRVRLAGVRLSPVQATLDAAQVLLPGIFVVVVTGIGAHLAVAGEITPGQLVAFYGYTAFLTMPLRTATEFVDKLVRTRVAARRIVRILAVEPDHEPAGRRRRVTCWSTWGHRGWTSRRHWWTRHPGSSSRRAGSRRWSAPARRRPPRSPIAWAGCSRGGTGCGGATSSSTTFPSTSCVHHVVVSGADPHLFSGPVRETLGGADDTARDAAVHVASAADALDSLDGGMDGELEERGRALSGGQRQRIALSRALLRDPDVLVLVEPTSAVDAHTEARIAQRLGAHRAGRTTVVVTASPLLLDTADVVLLVQDGVVTSVGRHHDLLRTDPAYRDVVLRGED